jgi:prolyl-tRNA synthetase
VTSASGGVFTDKFSHEFQTLCEVGEDTIYVHKDGKLAMNEEIFNEESLAKLGYTAEDFEVKKAAEVGNIFTFGTKKCEEMELFFTNKEGKREGVFLGSYGIGVTRVMGVITEIFADDKGMVWPEAVAPFKVHLIQLGSVADKATALYEKLSGQGIEVLLDDRDAFAGAKFADADLMGIPYRVVISDKSIEKGGLEFKKRTDVDGKIITEDELFSILVN